MKMSKEFFNLYSCQLPKFEVVNYSKFNISVALLNAALSLGPN